MFAEPTKLQFPDIPMNIKLLIMSSLSLHNCKNHYLIIEDTKSLDLRNVTFGGSNLATYYIYDSNMNNEFNNESINTKLDNVHIVYSTYYTFNSDNMNVYTVITFQKPTYFNEVGVSCLINVSDNIIATDYNYFIKVDIKRCDNRSAINTLSDFVNIYPTTSVNKDFKIYAESFFFLDKASS